MNRDRHEPATSDAVVSFDDEPLILVDENDRVLGHDTKAACHVGEGKLHRAISVFLFNGRGECLLQQRSASKQLWPMVWSNSCCSHPRRDEETADAAARRVREELGVDVPLQFLFKFLYHARYEDSGSERELCSVFIGRCDEPVTVNVNEIRAIESIHVHALDRDLAERPERYTPWMKIEWRRMREEHWPAVERLWRDDR